MRKIVISLATVTIAISLVLMLTSCSGSLSGTYYAEGGSFSGVYFNKEPVVSIEFKSMGKAEIVTGGFSKITYVDCTYKINGNEISLRAKWNYTDEWEGTYSFSKSGNTIIINGHPFKK